jgi:hypothetical protein
MIYSRERSTSDAKYMEIYFEWRSFERKGLNSSHGDFRLNKIFLFLKGFLSWKLRKEFLIWKFWGGNFHENFSIFRHESFKIFIIHEKKNNFPVKAKNLFQQTYRASAQNKTFYNNIFLLIGLIIKHSTSRIIKKSRLMK